jgi:protein-tyrosine phosphatase
MERYLCLREKGRVNELISTGCMLQMNYCSIAGSQFNSEVRWCRRQIYEEHIHLMGTDMHHINKRTPEIKKSLTWMKRNCSVETYQNLVSNNAQRILKKREQ